MYYNALFYLLSLITFLKVYYSIFIYRKKQYITRLMNDSVDRNSFKKGKYSVHDDL